MDSDGDYTDNEETLSPYPENVRTTPELRRTLSPRGETTHLDVHDPLRSSVVSRSPKKKKVGRSSYLGDDEDELRKSTVSNGSTTINRLFGRRDDQVEERDGGIYEEPPIESGGDGEEEVPIEGEVEGESKKKKIDYMGKLKKFKPKLPKVKLGGFIPNVGFKNIRTYGDVRRKKCAQPSYKGKNVFITSKTESRPTVEGVKRQLQKRRDRVSSLQQYYSKKNRMDQSNMYGYLLQKYNKSCAEYEKEQNENFRMMDYQLEGIYQGKKPYFARYNEHVVEQRCYRESEPFIRYCDDTGSFVSSYDPVTRGLYVRPNTFMTEFDEDIPLKKTVPFRSKISRSLLFKQGEQSNEEEEFYKLEVECQKLYFVDHPLMSEEVYCVQRLTQLCNRYRKMSSVKVMSFYEKKIEALLGALKEHKQLHSESMLKVSRFDLSHSRTEHQLRKSQQFLSPDMDLGYRMSNIRAQLRKARIGLEEEIYSHFQIVQDISTLWNRLRGVRQQQGFWLTNLGVKYSIIPPADVGKSNEDIQFQVEQEYEEYMDEIEWQKKRMQHELGKKKAELEDPLSEEEMVDKKREIYERIISHRLSPSQPTLIPFLVELEVPAVNEIPLEEKSRILEISKCQYFLKILINGKKVSNTNAAPLQNSFTIHFGEIMPVIVTKWPESICIEIRRKTGPLRSSRIASLFVSAPGLEESSGREGKRVQPMEEQKQEQQQTQAEGTKEEKGENEIVQPQPQHQHQQQQNQKNRRAKKKFEELDFNGTTAFVPAYEERRHIQNLRGNTGEEEGMDMYNPNENNSAEGHPREHYTSGRCVVRVSWGSLQPGDLPRAPPIPEDPSLLEGFFGRGNNKRMVLPTAKDLLNMQKLKRLLEGNTIDPNDPKNTGLLSMFELFRQKKLVRPGFFLTEQDEGVFLIPPKEYQKVLRNYSEEKMRKLGEELAEKQKDKDDGKKTKTLTKKEEKQIMRQQQQISASPSSRREYVGKYVDEPNLPSNIFKFVKNWIWDIFTPRRPLRPERRSLDEDMIPKFSRGQKHDMKIYCQILSAQNIPFRDPNFQLYANLRNKWLQFAKTNVQKAAGRAAYTTTRPTGDDYDDNDFVDDDVESGRKTNKDSGKEFEDFKDRYSGPDNLESILSEHPIEAFCEVFFQGSSATTTLYHSTSPQIGETLVLPLRLPDSDKGQNLSPEQLMNIEEIIYFDFFDMFQAKLGRDDVSSVDVMRRERRYLGTFSLPFSTLFINNGSVSGKFVVDVPLVNHGFIQQFPDKPMTFDVNITLDPPCPLPQDIQDIKVSGESPELTTHCKIWVMTKKKFSRTKKRNIMALAPNSSGRGTLLCRYIKAQKPPDDMQTPEQALRFVSLIPCKEDIHQFSERIDVWTNSQKFLDEGGDYEEHAILLCNYLLYMGKTAYVVLGNAFPEGITCYVFVDGDQDRGNRKELWDPSNGVIYEISDPLCPLYSVGVVFNQFNIWANIQIEEMPCRMKWVLSSRFNWDKLFPSEKKRRKLFNSEISVQRENLFYREPNAIKVRHFARQLKDRLRQVHFQLRSSVNENREEFDAVLEPQLVEILEYFENRKRENLEVNNTRYEEDKKMVVQKLGDKHQEMFGYPQNFRKMEIEEIIQQALHNTKFYTLQEKEEVQFCYAVYVKAYTKNVYSIWVYSACVFVVDDMYM